MPGTGETSPAPSDSVAREAFDPQRPYMDSPLCKLSLVLTSASTAHVYPASDNHTPLGYWALMS